MPNRCRNNDRECSGLAWLDEAMEFMEHDKMGDEPKYGFDMSNIRTTGKPAPDPRPELAKRYAESGEHCPVAEKELRSFAEDEQDG